jgi:hypothetical protein
MARFWTVLSLGLALGLCCGCSGSDAVVTGTVKIGDSPVEEGSILFLPTDGKTPTAGGPIKGGRYSVKVPIGSMKVAISCPRVVGKKKLYPTKDSPEQDVTQESVHPRHSDPQKTELTLEVKQGTNEKDWVVDRK